MEDIASADPPAGPALSPDDRDALVLEMVRLHADGLLRLARRHSLNADDAQDAYQRGLEIFLRHAHRLDRERAASWLRTVVKHEAMAVRRTRQRDLASVELDFDLVEARTTPSPEDRAIAFEHVARSAEALQRLKPQEIRALWLRAQGNSYDEIQQLTGWTRTKVNRCLYEGRRNFLARYAGIETGEECRRWEPLLSQLVDGEASREELLELRPHLRTCGTCRAAVRELHRSSTPLAGVFPLPLAVLTATHAEAAGHVFVKGFDAITTWLGERAASSMVRAQLLVDAVGASAGKATAVAAASAAVAGGGAVALQQAAPPAHRGPVAVVPVGRAVDASASVRELAIDREVHARLAAERRRAARRAAVRERRREARAAAAARSVAVGPRSAPASTPAATAPSATAAATASPPAAAVAAAPAPSSSGSAAAELGLE